MFVPFPRIRAYLFIFTVLFTYSVAGNAVTVSSGNIHKIEPFPSGFVEPRNVHIWLPTGFSSDKTYSVLYMHDGRALFDSDYSWNGQEWGVDEVATQLMAAGEIQDVIIVGVFNLGDKRHSEYFPQKPFETLSSKRQTRLYGLERSPGQPLFAAKLHSDRYLQFLVEELKPYIDKHYPVKTDRDHTFIMGSSMGGLISLYAAIEYPEVYSGAACLSTHWPGIVPVTSEHTGDLLVDWFAEQLPRLKNSRLYFDHGTITLDQHYPKLQSEVDRKLRAAGFDHSNWQTQVFEGAAHTEDAWRDRLHIPLEFLLGSKH